MSKESLAWLVLRVIGLVLLGFALLQLSYLPGSFLVLEAIRETTQNMGRVSGAEARVFSNLVNAIILLALSVYFLRGGSRVHRWLMREGKSHE